jgi:hypothetical protein
MPVVNRIQIRRGTEAGWTSANPVLAIGEPGLETDTGKFKWGDGTTAWNSLDYAAGSASVVVSETAPEEIELGSIWFNSSEGRSYIYYDGFFVELTPSIRGPIGPTGPAGPAGEDGPAGSDANTDELYALTLMGAI